MPPPSETRIVPKRVSDAHLKNAKPRAMPYKISVGESLYLEVMPTGAKHWRYKYRLAGKSNRFAIGRYPEITLREARALRDEARKLVKAGIHPSHKRQADRIRLTVEHSNTFQAVAEEWLAANAERWITRTYQQRKRALTRDVFPFIGALPIRQVTPAHVLHVLKRVESRAPTIAVILHQAIGGVFRLAISTLRADTDPTYPLRGATRTRPTEHHRPLKPAELPKLLQALDDDSAARFETRAALRLMLYTLARSVEVTGAAWVEFDLEAGLWVVPAARMKARESHTCPLPAQAIALLKRLQTITGHREHLFPNRDDPRRPASSGILWKLIKHMGFDAGFSPHGIRSTGSTLLHGMGYRSEWIEVQLAHSDRDKTRKSYNRALYIGERRTMMQAWCDYLDSLSKGGKVVPMKGEQGQG